MTSLYDGTTWNHDRLAVSWNCRKNLFLQVPIFLFLTFWKTDGIWIILLELVGEARREQQQCSGSHSNENLNSTVPAESKQMQLEVGEPRTLWWVIGVVPVPTWTCSSISSHVFHDWHFTIRNSFSFYSFVNSLPKNPMNPSIPVGFKTPENTIEVGMRRRELQRRKSKSASIEVAMHSMESKLLARVAKLTLSREEKNEDHTKDQLQPIQTPTSPLLSISFAVPSDLSFPDIGGRNKRSSIFLSPLTPLTTNSHRYKKHRHYFDEAPSIPEFLLSEQEMTVKQLRHRPPVIPFSTQSCSPFNTTENKTPCMKRRRRLFLSRQYQQNTPDFPYFPCLSPRDLPLIPTTLLSWMVILLSSFLLWCQPQVTWFSFCQM